MQRWCSVVLLLGVGLFAGGCPKGQTDYSKGRKAETLQDYDGALAFYEKALKSDPNNVEVHFALARLYQQRGDKQAAAREFAECATLRARREKTLSGIAGANLEP